MKPELYEQYSKFLTWFGDLYMATEPPLCKAKQIEDMLEIIQAGMVICRGYDAYIDSHFIPGEYTHSGIVINKREIIHSIAEGVRSIHPIDFIKDVDRFIILRPRYREADVFHAINRAIWHCPDINGTKYDFTFQEDGRFYCHEFTADCLSHATIQVEKTTKSFGVWPFRFKRDLYLAQNLIDVCSVIYEFNPEEEI